MSRQPQHRALPNGTGCSCGARFRKPRELRRHLTMEAGAYDVWISTPQPVKTRKGRRR